MNAPVEKREESEFMKKNALLFFKRFSISFYREGTCMEYFLEENKEGEVFSSSIILSCNPETRRFYVSRFYPELYHRPGSKYMSAVCFYLVVHHCAGVFDTGGPCTISLETVPAVSDAFYLKLKDFRFRVRRSGPGNNLELVSNLLRLPVDTSRIRERILKADEIPFLHK